MTDLTRRALRRLTMLALLAAVFLLAGWATPARADLDRIRSYTVTVDPRTDGSADITYDIDWEVIGGSPDEPLSWVRIGLANSAVDELENLSPDTVSQVRYTAEGGGSFAQVVFKNRYYPPDHAARTGSESRVQFAFRVHQSQLYTLNSDGTADYVFTPGWFSDLSIDQLTIRWKQLEGAAADTDTLADVELLSDGSFNLYQRVEYSYYEHFAGTFSVGENLLQGRYSDGKPWAGEYDYALSDGGYTLTLTDRKRNEVNIYTRMQQIPEDVRKTSVTRSMPGSRRFL